NDDTRGTGVEGAADRCHVVGFDADEARRAVCWVDRGEPAKHAIVCVETGLAMSDQYPRTRSRLLRRPVKSLADINRIPIGCKTAWGPVAWRLLHHTPLPGRRRGVLGTARRYLTAGETFSIRRAGSDRWQVWNAASAARVR